MERFTQKLEAANRAFLSFKDLILEDLTNTVYRDAAILRFQYTIETTWKAYQQYLKLEAIDLASPKAVLREAFKLNLINENIIEEVLDMVSDRNLVVHTYNEKLSLSLKEKLPRYYELLDILLKQLHKAAEGKTN